jgi:DNA-binding ferritin-like protein
MSNIISLVNYKQTKQIVEEKKVTANTVNSLITAMIQDYTSILEEYRIDVEDPDIAFDIATIQFLMRGMAHRSQGQAHPSQQILNVMRNNMAGA